MEPIIDNDWTNCKNDPVDEPDGIPNVTKSWVSREKGVDPPGGPSNKTVLENAAEDILVQKRLQSRRCDLPGYPRSTFLMVFSPDGTKVASTHGNHNVYVSELASGKHVCILRGHPRTPWCISFHPSHPQLIGSGCLGGQVRVWDLSGGSETWTVETETVISSLAFHPRDQLLVIATFSELYFWNWSQPAPHTRVSTNNFNEKVKYVAFDALGFKLITGIINVWTNSDQEGINQGIPQQAGNNNGAEGPGQFHIIPQSTRRMLADQQYESYTHLVRRYDSLVRNYHRLFMARQDFAHRAPRMARLSWHSVEETDRGTDPMETDGPIEVDWSIISGPNNSGTSNNHSTSSNASTSNTAAGADTASISGTSSISGTNSNSGITNDISTSNNSNTGNNSARNNRSSSTNNDGRVNPGPFNRRRISLRQIVADHDRRSVNGTANVSNMWVPLPRSSSGVTATSRVDPAPPTTSAPLHSSNSSSASSSSSTDSNTSTASTTSPRDRIPFGSRTSAFRPLGEYEQRIYIATPDMDPEDPTQPRVRLMRPHPNAPRRRIFMPPQQLFFSGRGALTPGATRPPPTSASSTTTTTSSAAADTARRPPSPRTTSSPGTNPADDTQMINESLDLIRDILRDSGARLLNLVTNMSLVTLANAEVGRVAINDAAHIPSLSTHRGVNRTAVFTAAGPTSLEDSMFGPLQPPSNGQTGTSNSHPGVFSTTGAAIDLTSRTSTSPSSASTTSSSRLGTDFVPATASTLPELFASFGSPTAPRLTRIGAYRSPGAPHDDAAARPVLFTASGPMPLSAPGPSTHMDETYPATLPSQTVHAARLTPYVNTRTSHVFGSGLFTASAPVPFTAPESAIRSVPSAMPSTSTDSSSFTVSGPFSASGPTPFGSWNGPPNSTTSEPIPVPQSEPRRQSNRLVFNLNPTPEERRLNSALYRRTTEGGMRNFLSKLYRHRFRVRNQNEAAPGASPSDTAPPDTAPPDTAPPDTAPPDTAPPDTAPPDTAPPVTAPPDTAPPDTAPPDTALLDTAPPDTAPPDTAPPDTAPPDTAPFDLNDDSDSADEDITRTAADRPTRLLSSREAFAKVETGVRALIRHSYMLSLMLSRGRRATYPELLKMWEDLRRHVLALDIQSRPANLSSAQYARTVMDRFRLISEVSRGITSQLEAGRPRPDEADVANRHAALFPSRAYDEILAGPSGVVPIRDPSSRRVTRASARALLLANTNTDAPATTEANSSAAARTRSRPRAASESRLAPHMTSRMRYYMMRKRLSANVRRRLDEDAHRRTGRPVTPLRQPRRRPGTTLDPNMPRAEIRVRAMQVLSVLFYMMMDCLEERDLSRIIIQMLKTIKRALRITCILLSNNPNREGRPTENESVVTEASSLSTTPADPGASTSAASGASASAVPTASTLDVPVASTSTVPAASTSDIPAEVPMDADCGSSSSSLSSDERNPPENFDPTALVNETATAALTPHRWSNRLAVQISAANRNYSSTARRRRDLYLEIRREKALHKCNPSANPIRKKKAQPPTASSRIPLLRRSSSARNLVMRSRPPTSDPGTSNVPSYATPPRPSTSQDNAPPPPSGATGGIEGRQAYRNRVELYRIAQLNAIRVRNAARERIRRLHTLRLYTSALREIDSIDEDVSEDLDGLDEVIDPEVQLIGVRGVDTLSRRAANAVRRDTDREVQRVAGESELGPAPGTDRDASRAGERNAGRTGDQPAGERGLRSGIIMARADQIESVINQIAVPIVQVNDLPVGDNQPPVVARVQPIILAQNAIVLEDGLANMHGLLDAGLMPETLPTHRVQAWDFTSGNPPDISDRTKNMIVQRCRIHNDASIDISKDGRLLVALLPMPRLRSSMHRLGVYSLEWDRLGQCLHTAALEQSAVSVALSPTSRYLAVGLGSRRFTYLPNTRNNVFALLYKLSPLDNTSRTGLTPIKELNQNWEQQFTSLNCLRWAPQPGQGLVYANNTGQLIIMS